MYKPFFDRKSFLSSANIFTESAFTIDDTFDFAGLKDEVVNSLVFDLMQAKPEPAPLFMEDDFTADSSTTGVVNLSGNTNGEFETNEDVDWFSITLTQGQSLTLATMGGANTLFSLRNSDGSIAQAADFTIAGPEDYYTFENMDAGTYYLQAEMTANNAPMNYTFTASTYVDDFAGNATTTGTANTDGSSTTSVLQSATDADWFAFTVGANDVFELLLSASPEPLLRVVDNAGATITADSTGNAGADMYAEYSTLAPGTYYVEMRPDMYGGSPSSYSFQGRQYTDDFADGTSTSGMLSTDGEVAGVLQGYGDSDWFEMDLVSGEEIIIHTTGLDLTMDSLQIRDNAGTVLGSASIEPVEGTLSFTPTTSGTHYVSVLFGGFGAFSQRNYTLSTSPEDDFEDDATTDGVVNLSGSTTGMIEYDGDRDWFAVTISEGETLTAVTSQFNYEFRLLNGDGTVASMGASYLDGPSFGTAFDDLSAGTYYLEVSAPSVMSFPANYSITARTYTDDHGDEIASATAITNSGSGTVTNEADSDWFSIAVGAGESLLLSYFDNPDIHFSLRDSAGNFVSSQSSGHFSPESYVLYSDLASGDYYIVANGMPAGGSVSFGFSAQTYNDDHGNDTSTNSDLQAFDDNVSGSLQSFADTDWFETNLNAGEEFSVVATGLDSGQRLRLYDAAGNNAGASYNSGTGELTFTPGASGIFFVAVEYTTGAGPVSNVNYSLSTEVPDDFEGDITTDGTVNFGTISFASTSGTIENSSTTDSDWFAITLSAGQTLQIIVNDIAGYPAFGFADASGNAITDFETVSENAAIAYLFTAETSGTYYVTATEVMESGLINYVFDSHRYTDDIGGTAATAQAANIGGANSGVATGSLDEDWFEITVAEGETIVLNYGPTGTEPTTRLLNADGSIASSGTNIVQGNVFDDLSAGTYYIAVSQDLDARLSLNYNIGISTHVDDHGDDATEATSVTSSTSGSLESIVDEDWFSVEIAAGEDLEISFISAPFGPSVDVRLVDAAGNPIAGGSTVTDIGPGSDFTGFQGLAAGTYYLRVEHTGFENTPQNYSFDVTQYVDDHGDTASDATAIAALDGTASGVLSGPTDQDVFEVDLVAGELFYFTTTGLPSGFDQVQVTRDGSTVDVGASPHETSFSFTPTVTGTYTITISLDPMFASSTPTAYTVSTEIPDDFTSDDTTAGNLQINSSVLGTIEQAGDTDWFRVTVSEGQTLVVGDENADLEFRLLTADGTVVSEGVEFIAEFVDDISYHEEFQDLSAGIYYLEVSAPTGTPPVDYRIQAEVYTDDHGDTQTDATVVTGNMSGRISTSIDADWFELTITQEPGAVFELFSQRPVVGLQYRLRNSDGTLVDPTTAGIFENAPIQQYENLADGTYYVEVVTTGPSFFDSFYQLTTRSSVDDHGSDTSTTSSLPLEGRVDGVLEAILDEDWFSVMLTASEEFRVNAAFEFPEYARVRLFNNLGESVPITPVERDTGFVFTPTVSGEYFVVIERDLTYPTSSLLEYSLTLGIPDDYAGDATTDGILIIGAEVTGVTEHVSGVTDEDWFSVEVMEGETLHVDIQGFIGNDYLIVDENGVRVLNLNEGVTAISFTAQSTGTYYVVVKEIVEQLRSESYSLFGTIYVDDFSADSSTVGLLADGLVVSGQYQAQTDSDWFAIDIEEGQTVKVNLNQDYSQTDLQLVNALGHLLASEQLNSSGNTSFITYTASATGTYYVRTQSTNFSETQAYELSAEIIPTDLADSNLTEGLIAVGETLNGILEQNYDEDWFGFSAAAGEIVRFTLDGVEASRVNLRIFNESGQTLYQFFSSGTDQTEVLSFIAPEAGDFFVEVDAGFLGASFVDYSLTAENVVDDYTNDATTTGSLMVGGTAIGELDVPYDIDWVAVELTEGVSTRFFMDSNVNSFALVDATGEQVATSFTALEGRLIEVLSPQTGTFYLQMSGGVEGTSYTLTGETFVDDFEGDLDTTGSVVLGVTFAGNIDFIGDTDWYELEVSDGDSIFASLSDTDDLFSWMRIGIFDADGNRLVDSGGYTANSELSHTFSTGGTYYIAAEGYGSTFSTISAHSSYALSVFDVSHLGTDFSDVLSGTTGDDTIVGLSNRDLIRGFEGDDTILAGAGSDRIEGGAGADHIDGGSGNDYVAFTSSLTGVNVNLQTGVGSGGDAEGDTYVNVEWVIGSTFDDVIVGTSVFNFIVGGDGADTMTGGDHYSGDSFAYRRLNGQMDGDVITDFSFNDYINLFSVWESEAYTPDFIGTNAFSGRAGEIRYELSGQDTLILVDTNGDGAVNETLTLLGFSGDLSMDVNFYIRADVAIVGNSSGTILYGTANNDVMAGLAGNDTLQGGAGDDLLEGGEGDDIIEGGAGNDTTAYVEATSGVSIDLAITDIQDTLGAGMDRLVDIENILGSSFNDVLRGDAGSNDLNGGAGRDTLEGRVGNDALTGGAGADTFVFRDGDGEDTITDFEVGSDRLSFLSIDPYTDYSVMWAMMSVDGDDVIIDMGDGDSIRLLGVDLEDLTAQHFRFGDNHADGVGPFRDGYVYVEGGIDKSAPPAQEKPDVVPVAEPLETDDTFAFKEEQTVDIIADVMDETSLSDVTGDFVATPDQLEAFALAQIDHAFEADPIYYLNEWGILNILTPDDNGYWAEMF